jgi:integrase
LSLEWDRIVGTRAVLPDSKTGPRVIWLNTPAQDILDRRRTSLASPFVFPAPRSNGPIRVIDWGWRLICNEAGITGLRVHDLRHHFASVAVSNGIDLRIVGQLLGYRDIDSTLGYAHLASAALVQSASRVSGFIDGAMNGGRARTASPLTHKGDATHA